MSFDIQPAVDQLLVFFDPNSDNGPLGEFYQNTKQCLVELLATQPDQLRCVHTLAVRNPKSFLTVDELRVHRGREEKSTVQNALRSSETGLIEDEKTWPTARNYNMFFYPDVYVIDHLDRVLFLTSVALANVVHRDLATFLKGDQVSNRARKEVMEFLNSIASPASIQAIATSAGMLAVVNAEKLSVGVVERAARSCIGQHAGQIIKTSVGHKLGSTSQASSLPISWLPGLEAIDLHVAINEAVAQQLDPTHNNWVDQVLLPMKRRQIPYVYL